ncbi:hypothetical protein AMTR_s00054p00095100 [Amborella trichopoda]|uniref:RNase H type-1 domain-containing protein n=1 Tax=Amborella trichopoda TaxID=13333 RepID=U5DCL8_AMBTC|nr:hypothetical protein AMTR_s00054p00095100 [Amborella trichopoda]
MPPPSPYLKLNFDGSVRNNGLRASLLWMTNRILPPCQAIKAELLGLKLCGLKVDTQVIHLIIEGDSSNIIKWSLEPKWTPRRWITTFDDIRCHLTWINALFQVVNREYNSLADELDKATTT